MPSVYKGGGWVYVHLNKVFADKAGNRVMEMGLKSLSDWGLGHWGDEGCFPVSGTLALGESGVDD